MSLLLKVLRSAGYLTEEVGELLDEAGGKAAVSVDLTSGDSPSKAVFVDLLGFDEDSFGSDGRWESFDFYDRSFTASVRNKLVALANHHFSSLITKATPAPGRKKGHAASVFFQKGLNSLHTVDDALVRAAFKGSPFKVKGKGPTWTIAVSGKARGVSGDFRPAPGDVWPAEPSRSNAAELLSFEIGTSAKGATLILLPQKVRLNRSGYKTFEQEIERGAKRRVWRKDRQANYAWLSKWRTIKIQDETIGGDKKTFYVNTLLREIEGADELLEKAVAAANKSMKGAKQVLARRAIRFKVLAIKLKPYDSKVADMLTKAGESGKIVWLDKKGNELPEDADEKKRHEEAVGGEQLSQEDYFSLTSALKAEATAKFREGRGEEKAGAAAKAAERAAGPQPLDWGTRSSRAGEAPKDSPPDKLKLKIKVGKRGKNVTAEWERSTRSSPSIGVVYEITVPRDPKLADAVLVHDYVEAVTRWAESHEGEHYNTIVVGKPSKTQSNLTSLDPDTIPDDDKELQILVVIRGSERAVRRDN